MGLTTLTLWYPHTSTSRLRHGTQVYCYGMGQSRIYAMPYPQLAAYMAIDLPKARNGAHSLKLWYHHISTPRLCHNGTLVWLRLTYMPPCMYTLQSTYSVTLWYPHISPSPLRHGTLLWYPGMGKSHMWRARARRGLRLC